MAKLEHLIKVAAGGVWDKCSIRRGFILPFQFYGDRSASRLWLHSNLARLKVSAVNHLDADRGRFADNVDPFEVKVGWRPAPLMGACLFCTFLSDKGCPPSAGWNSSWKNVSMLAFTRQLMLAG